MLFPELALPVRACEDGRESAPPTPGMGPLPCPGNAEDSVLGASFAATELAGLSSVPWPTAANSSLTVLCGSELVVVWSRPPTAPVSVPGARVAVLVEVECDVGVDELMTWAVGLVVDSGALGRSVRDSQK